MAKETNEDTLDAMMKYERGVDGYKKEYKKHSAAKKKAVASRMKEHYGSENQRKLHYEAIKKVVKPEFRGEKYEKVNRAFPIK